MYKHSKKKKWIKKPISQILRKNIISIIKLILQENYQGFQSKNGPKFVEISAGYSGGMKIDMAHHFKNLV